MYQPLKRQRFPLPNMYSVNRDICTNDLLSSYGVKKVLKCGVTQWQTKCKLHFSTHFFLVWEQNLIREKASNYI